MSIIQSQSPARFSEHDEQPGQPLAALASPLNQTTIDPILALELRVRWLEALILGVTGPLDPPTSTVDTARTGRETRGIDDRTQKGRGNFKSLRGTVAEKQEGNEKGKGRASATLARLTEDVKKRLDAIVESNEGLKKFMDACT